MALQGALLFEGAVKQVLHPASTPLLCLQLLEGILGPPRAGAAAPAPAARQAGASTSGSGAAAPAAAATSKGGAPGRRGYSSSLLKSGAKKPLRALPAAQVAAAPTSLQDAMGAPAGSAGAAGTAPDKVIIFSQWTQFLDLIEGSLQQAGRRFRRVDGSMTLTQRCEQLEGFKKRADVGVLLLSLRAASLGLNLAVANHVVLMDLWYNPAVEEQVSPCCNCTVFPRCPCCLGPAGVPCFCAMLVWAMY